MADTGSRLTHLLRAEAGGGQSLQTAGTRRTRSLLELSGMEAVGGGAPHVLYCLDINKCQITPPPDRMLPGHK